MAGMALIDADRAKKFKIFRNGDPRFFGKEFVLNKRRIRTWDAFLQAATNDVKSTDAVRSIRTPTNGTRIQSLDDLQDSYSYVAVGNGKFKKLGYLNIETNLAASHGKQSTSPRNADVIPVGHSRIQASGRIRKVPVDVVTIFVYANGKDLEAARRVTLTHQMLRSWDAILAQVTEKINPTSAARRLCSLEGQQVTDLSSIKTGSYYVAVGAEVGGFKKLDYGAQRPAFNSSPKRDRSPELIKSRRSSENSQTPRRLEPISYVPLKQRKPRKGAGSENGTGPLNSSVNSTGSSQNSSQKSSPMANKPRKQERAKPPPNKRQPPKKEEEDVFHARPVKHKRSGEKRKEIDLDKDEGGVFKAKGGNDETQNAEEVEETKETAVDLPIDQVEAEEVKDEEIEEDNNKKSKKDTPRKDSKPPTPKGESKPPTPAPRQASVSPVNSKRPESQKSSTPKPAEEEDLSDKDTNRKEQEDAAATKIQASYRGHHTRQAYQEQKNEMKKDAAATKIQASYRGHNTRKNMQKRKEEKAAAKIQASYRGHVVRKEIQKQRDEEQDQEESITDSDMEMSPPMRSDSAGSFPANRIYNKAATKIQASYRGHQTRKELKAAKENETKKDEAATKIQASYRGYCTRKELEAKVKREYEAATKIQSGYRGYKGRQLVDGVREQKRSENEQEENKDNIEELADETVIDEVGSAADSPEITKNKQSDEEPDENYKTGDNDGGNDDEDESIEDKKNESENKDEGEKKDNNKEDTEEQDEEENKPDK